MFGHLSRHFLFRNFAAGPLVLTPVVMSEGGSGGEEAKNDEADLFHKVPFEKVEWSLRRRSKRNAAENRDIFPRAACE